MDNCTCISREIVSIVYGNDFTIEAHVSVYDKDEGIYKLLDLTGVKKCQMCLVGTYRKAIGKDVAVSGSKVTAFFPGGSVGVGTYGVEITFVDSLGKGRIFERNLIGIVSASGDATVDNDIEGEAGEGLNVSVNVLTRIVRIGGGGSVLADYNLLENRPSIGGVTLEGNKRPSDLGMYSKEEADAAISKEETDRKAAVAALQSLIDILNSDSNVDGSVKKTVADAIARVVAGAPEDLDTLKEIADYIASDKTGAAELAAAISALKTLTAGHTKSIEDLGIAKQDALVSGTNIKTINNQSILGSGNISIESGTSITVDSELSTTSENPVQNKVITNTLQTKANASDIPTKVSQLENDSKFATQTAVATGLATKADKDSLTSLEGSVSTLETTVRNQDKSIIANAQAIQGKQDKLVSGTNIKTINNQSILGSGNISIEGGGTITVDDALSDTSENPVQNKVITTKVNSLETSLGSKASQTDLDSLSSTVTTQGQTITSIQAEIGDINTQLTEING